MRDIRARIVRQPGLELSDQQIQELAARRLESILDVRSVNPALMEQLRRSISTERAAQIPSRATEPAYSFEDTTIYESDSGLTRTLRRLFNPLLKLLFNPNPMIRALHLQAGINTETARREAERDQRQAEWNALHYEMLQRLVTEMARLSAEVQAVGPRVESLDAKVDFNERRVRAMESQQGEADTRGAGSQSPRHSEPRAASQNAPAEAGVPATGEGLAQAGDGTRKRRRRRRGRRSGAGDGFQPGGAAADGGSGSADGGPDLDGDDEDGMEESGVGEMIAPDPEPAHLPATDGGAPSAVDAPSTPSAQEPDTQES